MVKSVLFYLERLQRRGVLKNVQLFWATLYSEISGESYDYEDRVQKQCLLLIPFHPFHLNIARLIL